MDRAIELMESASGMPMMQKAVHPWDGEPHGLEPEPGTNPAPALVVGLSAITVGIAVLIGWQFDIPVLKSVLPSFVTMKANTAGGFILAGLSLVLWTRPSRSAVARPLALVCAGLTALLGLLTLVQYLLGLDLGIDQALFRDRAGAAGALWPGRMPPAAAINFLLLGCGLLFASGRRTILPMQCVALLTGLMALLPLMGYLYGASELIGVGPYSQMAVHTAFLFVLLSLGVLLLHRTEGLMKAATSDTPGGWLVREMVPFAVLLPPVLGWFRVQGERGGYFDSPLGTALMMVCLMVLFTGQISWSAHALNVAEAGRRLAEQADLTGRRQTMRALEASEIRYRRLFEAAKDGILILEADTGKIVDVNPFLMELTGYPREDFLGLHLWEIGAFRDIAASKDSFAELQIQNYVRYDDLPLKACDGREIAVEFVSNCYTVDGLNVIQCNIRDITVRKQAEQALQHSEERFRVLFEQAADSILVLEIRSEGPPIIRDVNIATLRLLGYARDELIGQPVSFLEAEPGSSRAVDERLRNRPPGTGISFEIRHACKDGTILEFECSMREIHIGRATYAISVERDITQRKLTEAAARHQQKLESIGTLASGVAHEINNPLNVIMNYGQLLLDNPGDEAKVKDFAHNVLKESERMAVIVRNLLSFARQDKNTFSPAQIADIVQTTLSLVRVVLRKDQITIQCEIPEGLPAIKCRSQQIQQVVMNLLINGRDALNERHPKAGDDKTIRIVAASFVKEGADWVRLTVEDHGCGIPADVAGRVFDPFFTTKGRDQGTGLGLSISHGIVREHQGMLWFETEPGKGTRFHLDLPVDNGMSFPNPVDA